MQKVEWTFSYFLDPRHSFILTKHMLYFAAASYRWGRRSGGSVMMKENRGLLI